MAVSCGNCGRQYDVTLFQFGRTINCACGERVGFEHKLNLPARGELKFFADVMLARLSKWLRAIGIDTEWEDAIADDDLVKRSILEKRFILTLDKKLTEQWRVDNVFVPESEDVFRQFCEVIRHFDIPEPKHLFNRCLVCNTPLKKTRAEQITADLPPNILETHDAFRYCAGCERIYWEGSHTRRMRERIERAFSRVLRGS